MVAVQVLADDPTVKLPGFSDDVNMRLAAVARLVDTSEAAVEF